MTLPEVTRHGNGNSLSMHKATDVLPDPLSPVKPSVPPSRSERETLLTALTVPSSVANSAERSSMRRIGAVKRTPCLLQVPPDSGRCCHYISAAQGLGDGITAQGLSREMWITLPCTWMFAASV